MDPQSVALSMELGWLKEQNHLVWINDVVLNLDKFPLRKVSFKVIWGNGSIAKRNVAVNRWSILWIEREAFFFVKPHHFRSKVSVVVDGPKLFRPDG